MDTQANGLPPEQGQPNPGNPAPTGQPNTTTPTPEPGTQPTQDNPQLAELQKKLEQLEERERKATESARYYQSNFDKAQQQLKAVVGVQPQQDPLAEDVKFFTAQGYEEKDARTLAEFMARKTQPLMQQLQAAQQTIQATNAIGQVIQSAASDADYAPLFNDPAIAQQVSQELQRIALAGGGEMLNPNYAKEYAAIIWASQNKPWKQGGGQPQNPNLRPPMPNYNFMGPAGSGFQPAAPAIKQINPVVQQVNQEIKSHFGLK